MDYIEIKGAKVHNLKNCDVKFPRNKLVTFTGVSGSGKSSLAFDTIYAEGQRRYVESLSTYARQFLGQMYKPEVESITGLSPAIAIDQKTTSRNPRSTVGTVTEIYDYYRLLYSKVGVPHCYKCGSEIKSQTVDQIVDSIMGFGEGVKIQILSPVVMKKKGKHEKILENLKKQGFVRVRIDGEIHDLMEDEISLDKNKKHDMDVLVDRVVIKQSSRTRVFESVETSLRFSDGIVKIDVIGDKEFLFSEKFSCINCQISIQELAPRSFSFNAPFGKCNECDGLGMKFEIDPKLIIEDDNLSISEGVFKVSGFSLKDGSFSLNIFKALSEKLKFSLDVPFKDLSNDIKEKIFFGIDDYILVENEKDGLKSVYRWKFEGIINNLKRRYRESSSDYVKREISNYTSNKICESCNGARLRPEILSVKFGGINIYELTCLSVEDTLKFFDSITLSEKENFIAASIIQEIKDRLLFLNNVGLSYLNLSRTASTLSGGELQRIRLATQIGSSLVGVLYVLDEPSIGLHQRDNEKLINTLKNLRDIGNTVVVVEHDEDTIRESDFIIDIGKFAGENGGNVIYQGSYEGILDCKDSITGDYLSGRKKIDVPSKRNEGNGMFLKVIGAEENNLKNISVDIPLGTLTVVTGVSGSGKSTFVNEILYKGVNKKLNVRTKQKPGKFKDIQGIENIDKIIDIDQSPIGRTPRSNPATYIGVFDFIRELFSSTNDSKIRGYKPGRFSFNVKGGRCEACQGDGVIKIEMQFLSDVYVVCDVCKGTRYNKETLDVKYKGKNISDVLNMNVSEALSFFESIPKIYNKIKTLDEVGLSYIKLGQSSTTLSGGEAQRIKLASELSKKSTGKTLYILDEPTTGLHIYDVSKLINILKMLVESGNTVVVIEHNLDVIKNADYIIDLGSEGGANGGQIIAKGTPEEIVSVSSSHTGKYLSKYL